MRSGGPSLAARGFTLIEMLVTLALVGVLAMAALPVAEATATRAKEQELKTALRQIRAALDQYKNASDMGLIRRSPGESGYPPSLDLLAKPVGGVAAEIGPGQLPLIFLREVPRDPFATDPTLDAVQTWDLRSYVSAPDDPQPGADVFDVHSKSTRVGLNGIPYSRW
ncbi:type II secretion system protein [Ramlibacter sp. MMS24-I3-19]|uniref:type II secretion system protein n=1 Tax=Ramlibacter sp. MMS24-I3-19 TaxID=3416606 RepID=UPI003D0637C0